ncbi:MAG: penicillin-binding protein 1A [Burkholderiaceae bacterium]
MKTPRIGQKGLSATSVLGWIVGIPAFLAVCACLGAMIVLMMINDRLPPIDSMVDYRPKLPLKVYTVDNQLIGEFGQERRQFVSFEQAPDSIKQAILAAEDARFFEHRGVDFIGVARAAVANFTSGRTAQGGSTITMQLAREFFLSSERTYSRKLTEVLLALRIENTLSKQEIFELYLNQIFLGKRSYGFQAAASTYFDKKLSDLTIAEAAMLAGLPKAPSRYNPFVNPKRAKERQLYILRRMLENGFIDQATHDASVDEEMVYTERRARYVQSAPYVSELARRLVYKQYGDDAYSAGLRVYTTIHSRDQAAARTALRNGVLDYDIRSGYGGPEARIELSEDPVTAREQILAAIESAGDRETLLVAVVTKIQGKTKGKGRRKKTTYTVTVSRGDEEYKITGDGLKLVEKSLGKKAEAETRVQVGAVVRIVERDGQWRLTQNPDVQAAFVAVNTHDGSIRALVGGYDFQRNRFNRVTQAWRQPGSSFKPFIFSAALGKGLMTSTVVNDAPISLIDEDPIEGPQLWEPKNFDGRFDGPMTLRTALARSKNMVSVRVMQQIGARYARDYVGRFGFDPAQQPPVLTLGLGSGLVTPLQMVSGISVFANGGYRVDPYLISHITDAQGNVVSKANPRTSGDEANRAIDPRNAYIIDSMLRDVVRRGTARRAQALKRPDIAGKTGTTNDSFDAWFVGYQPTIAATAWIGFDQPRELGERETGGGAALPIWLEYMQTALKDVPVSQMQPPNGVVQVKGDLYLTESTPDIGVRSLGMREGGIATGVKGRRTAERLRNQVF